LGGEQGKANGYVKLFNFIYFFSQYFFIAIPALAASGLKKGSSLTFPEPSRPFPVAA
jgi:hypothetical protein